MCYQGEMHTLLILITFIFCLVCLGIAIVRQDATLYILTSLLGMAVLYWEALHSHDDWDDNIKNDPFNKGKK